MPELPEVETIANGLNKRVAGDRIDSVWLGSKPEPLKSPAAEISRTLEGSQVQRVRRVGKHIVFDLESGKNSGGQWIVHLGMTDECWWPHQRQSCPHIPTWWPKWRLAGSCALSTRGALDGWR